VARASLLVPVAASLGYDVVGGGVLLHILLLLLLLFSLLTLFSVPPAGSLLALGPAAQGEGSSRGIKQCEGRLASALPCQQGRSFQWEVLDNEAG